MSGPVRAIRYRQTVQVCPWLFVIGVVAEFVGIILLAFPDLLPGAIRFSAWLRRQGRRAANAARRLFGRPPRHVVVTGGMSGGIAMAGGATGRVSTEATTLEGKVDYLMRRDQDVQAMFDSYAARLVRIEKESPEQLDALRREMREHFAAELTAALEAYRPLRVAGALALAIGLTCVTLATLLA